MFIQYHNVINQVISYWPSYRSELGPVTGPIRNFLINDNFIN